MGGLIHAPIHATSSTGFTVVTSSRAATAASVRRTAAAQPRLADAVNETRASYSPPTTTGVTGATDDCAAKRPPQFFSNFRTRVGRSRMSDLANVVLART